MIVYFGAACTLPCAHHLLRFKLVALKCISQQYLQRLATHPLKASAAQDGKIKSSTASPEGSTT